MEFLLPSSDSVCCPPNFVINGNPGLKLLLAVGVPVRAPWSFIRLEQIWGLTRVVRAQRWSHLSKYAITCGAPA